MMQQTDKYKLNLLETSDAFSPSPLNENMEKVETKLAALDGADAAEAAARQALDQRVTALEVHKIVVGSYQGDRGSTDRTWRTFELGFAPAAVIIQIATSHQCKLVLPNVDQPAVRVFENGFQVCNTGGSDGLYNVNHMYIYLALA